MCTSSQVGDHWLWKKTQGAPQGLVSSGRFLTCITLSNMWARGRKEMSTSSCLGKITFCRWRAWETERKETLTGRQQESHKIIKRKMAPEEQKGKDCQERRERQTQGSVKATASWSSVSSRSRAQRCTHRAMERALLGRRQIVSTQLTLGMEAHPDRESNFYSLLSTRRCQDPDLCSQLCADSRILVHTCRSTQDPSANLQEPPGHQQGSAGAALSLCIQPIQELQCY